MTIIDAFADYITHTKYADFSRDAVNIAKLSVLDSIGCAFGASKMPAGKALIDLVKYLGGRPEAPLLGTNVRTSSSHAAFANTEMANVLDIDDTYPHSGHVGSSVAQTALAVGSAQHVSGKELLTAIIQGYEVTTRVGTLIMHPKFAPAKTSGHVFMVFGAAAVASKLLHLDTEQTAMALGMAGAATPIPSDEKVCLNPNRVEDGFPKIKNNYGISAETAVRAALMAQRGYKGPVDLFEGDTGFPVMVGVQNYGEDDLKNVVHDLNGTPRILNLQFKPYPCCRHAHPAIDAALYLVEKHQISLDDISHLVVKTFSARARPPLSYTFPNSVALALSRVPPGPEWYNLATRQRVQELANKITVEADPEADDYRRKGHYTLATVQITTNDTIYEKQVLHPKGSAENPLTDEELHQKFLNLASTTLNLNQAREIIHLTDNLETMTDINELADSLLTVS